MADTMSHHPHHHHHHGEPGPAHMRVEAVIVCVGYADFLAVTLPINLPFFDSVVVVTSYEDAETVELCRRYSVTCRPTNLHRKDGDPFAKGRAVDFGLAYHRRDSWLCHLDADIVLPRMTRQWFRWANLDDECIYGIDRVNCRSWDAWQKFRASHHDDHDYHCRVHIPPFPMSDRIAIADYEGYVPIGFFQLWHGKHHRRYPLAQSDGEHSDVLHALQWPSRNRRLMPEIIGIHLESEAAPLGANWKGRKTKRFGPS